MMPSRVSTSPNKDRGAKTNFKRFLKIQNFVTAFLKVCLNIKQQIFNALTDYLLMYKIFLHITQANPKQRTFLKQTYKNSRQKVFQHKIAHPIRISQAKAISNPPPNATPSITAIDGIGRLANVVMSARRFVTKCGTSLSGIIFRSFKSAPAKWLTFTILLKSKPPWT